MSEFLKREMFRFLVEGTNVQFKQGEALTPVYEVLHRFQLEVIDSIYIITFSTIFGKVIIKRLGNLKDTLDYLVESCRIKEFKNREVLVIDTFGG